jgi:hypothetical protein
MRRGRKFATKANGFVDLKYPSEQNQSLAKNRSAKSMQNNADLIRLD